MTLVSEHDLPAHPSITATDLRMALCVMACLLVGTVLDELSLQFSVGEMRISVIQKLTACIACILVCQDDSDASQKAGVTRLVVTAVGGLVGFGVVMVNELLGGSVWLLVPLVAVGVLGSLVVCRLTGVPAFQARIGAVTFVLVACTLPGKARCWYALFRLVSTLFGVVVSVVATRLWERYLPSSR